MKGNNIIKLRELTGAGVMDCKNALEEADNDFEKAKKIIQEKGIAKADKKSGRATSAGMVEAYVHADRIGVILEIHCETDFVARTDDFKKLAHEIAMHIAAMNPDSVDNLIKQEYIRESGTLISDLIKKSIAKFGENIRLERFCRYEL